ncbi:hypothetical protein Tco_0710636 [Tanacetum coccineum]
MMQEQESTKSDEDTVADYEHEHEELGMWLTVVPDEEETMDPEILSAKYPIVDWESQNLGNVDMEDLHVYKIIRADGNTSYHKLLFSMLRKFDRQDLVDLHRLVMKRFEDNTLEGYNLLLWGDLKIMFEPNAEDEIWSNQRDWTLISWKLYENCGVHTLLDRMLEAEAESTMTTLAEHIIVAGAENHPPMLKKSMYDSWASNIRLFIKGKKHGRMMLDSIDNGPLVFPTVEENRQTRPKKYSELTEAQQI